MKLDGKVVIEAPPERVWEFLLDPKKMKECLPYCESLERVDERTFRAVVKVKVTVIEANFALKTTIAEQRPFELLRLVTEGEDRRLASLVRQENVIELVGTSGGGTELGYRADLSVTGRLGKLGLTVLMTKARAVADDFLKAVKARIEASAKGGTSGTREGEA